MLEKLVKINLYPIDFSYWVGCTELLIFDQMICYRCLL